MERAEAFITHIFIWTNHRFSVVDSFRSVSSLGLPHATPQLYQKWAKFAQSMAYDQENEKFFLDKKKFFETVGSIDTFSQKMAHDQIKQFEAIVDAASLVFSHSVLDSAALDYCRLTALIEPKDWEFAVQKKNVPLDQLRETTYEEMFRREVDKYFSTLERRSLLEKVDRLFQVCKPPAGFRPMKNYKYKRDRLEQLDQIRHDIVHGDGPINKLPNGEEDILYLRKTNMFLLALVNHRYDVKVNPSYVITEQTIFQK